MHCRLRAARLTLQASARVSSGFQPLVPCVLLTEGELLVGRTDHKLHFAFTWEHSSVERRGE